MTATKSQPHVMSCMEVWGGNHAVDQGVVMPGLDLWVFSAPHEGHDQGGDVHYLSSCGTGRISRLVIADVSGHGSQAGEFARSLRALMRKFVNFLDQTRFVEALNLGFLKGESGLFATSVAMTFFAPSRQLDVCNAGHPRPFWYQASTGTWSVLESGRVAGAGARDAGLGSGRGGADGAEPSPANLPLGILEPTQYEQFGVRLARNDLVLVYTDALTESRDVHGAMLGEDGLLRILQGLDASRPTELIPALVEALDAYRNRVPADDDVTILLLRHSGAGVQKGFGARLGACFRFLGILGGRLIPGVERRPIPWPELSKVNLLGAMSRRVSESWRGPSGAAPPAQK